MKKVDIPEFLKIRKKLFGVCSIQQFLRVRSQGDVMAELLEAGADMELQDKKGKMKASAVDVPKLSNQIFMIGST